MGMMKNFKSGLLGLAACASVFAWTGCAINYYRPYDGGVGYSDISVAKDKAEIMFYGADDQDPLTAKQYAMVRAAEIGKQSNFPYFRITNDKEKEQNQREFVQTETYNSGYYHHRRPGWGGGTDVQVVEYDEKRPVIRLVVQYQNDDCPECLSVDVKLREGVEQGILKP